MIQIVFDFNLHQDQLAYLRNVRSVQGMRAVYEQLDWLAMRYDVSRTREVIERAKPR